MSQLVGPEDPRYSQLMDALTDLFNQCEQDERRFRALLVLLFPKKTDEQINTLVFNTLRVAQTIT